MPTVATAAEKTTRVRTVHYTWSTPVDVRLRTSHPRVSDGGTDDVTRRLNDSLPGRVTLSRPVSISNETRGV